MSQPRIAQAVILAASLAAAAPQPAASATCDADSCTAPHSSLFAIAHDHNDYANSILYRVTLPEQATGTNWGDGSNGFFYRVTDNLGQSYRSIVPFNGIGVNSAGAPTLRPFWFIVKVPTTATQISVQACASNYVGDSGGAAKCSKILWTDTYTSLPSPSVGAPAGFPPTLSLAYLDNAVSVRNNGVYGARVLLKPSASLTEEQSDWLYDHLVFLDSQNNVYTNDVLADSTASPSFAALTIEQAAHPTAPGASTYNTKYGQIAQPLTPNDPSQTPNRWFWVYSTNVSYVGSGQSIPVGVGWLYDASVDCPGALSGDDNSNSSNCGLPAPESAPGSSNATLELTVLDGSDVSVQAQSQHAAGERFVRTLDLSVDDSRGLCTAPVNPLAVNAAGGTNLPNYVIDRRTASGSDPWAKAFPSALYFVLPTGFGNCAGAEAPFCDLTSGYTAYVPGYLDQNGLGGNLNGNSTAAPLLGSAGGTLKLFDQYKLDDLAGAASNTLVWFDNCGYGHLYQDDSLSARLSLPPASKQSATVFKYAVANQLGEPVVLAKDCCASLYQQNTATCTQQPDGTLTDCTYDPPQQIGSSLFEPDLAGSGLYVPAGTSVSYSTLFSDELTTVYNAATGLPLFQLRLMAGVAAVTDAGTPVLFDCADPGVTVLVTASETAPQLTLGATGTGSIGCTAGIGRCPWPMAAADGTGSLTGYTTCTLDYAQQSSLILGVDQWASAVLADDQPVILMAWGAEGDAGQNKSGGKGGAGGAGGFASTVIKGSELMSIRGLYAYVGNRATGYSTLGGSSSILAKVPLSSLSVDQLQTLTPGDDVYLIGGGGGGGGDASNDAPWHYFNGGVGGAANNACANTSAPLPGPAVSAAGSNGTGGGGDCGVGKGGNPNGKGDGGASTGTGAGGSGIGGWGLDNQWRGGGSLVFINTPAPSGGTPTGQGVSSHNYGGAGGGGWGGGGSGDSCSGSGAAGSGAGGGGTFAAGNTAYDANAPSGGTSCKDIPPQPASPSPGGYGAIQFAYVARAQARPGAEALAPPPAGSDRDRARRPH